MFVAARKIGKMTFKPYMNILVPAMALLLLALPGCKGARGTSAQTAQATTSPAGSAASSRPLGAPKLSGVYLITEIEHDGRVDVRGTANTAIQLTFFPSGQFSRIVQPDVKTSHLYQGDFRVEADEVVFITNIVDKKPQTSAVEKRQPFKLSDDGTELKLGDGNNRWAVFRRVKELDTETTEKIPPGK